MFDDDNGALEEEDDDVQSTRSSRSASSVSVLSRPSFRDEQSRDSFMSEESQKSNRSTNSHSPKSNNVMDEKDEDDIVPASQQQDTFFTSTQRGRRMDVTYTRDNDLAEEDAAKQRSALEMHIKQARFVHDTYRQHANDVMTSLQAMERQQRELEPETNGQLFAYMSAVNKGNPNQTAHYMQIGTTCHGKVRVESVEDYHTKILDVVSMDLTTNILSTLVETPAFTSTGVRLCVRLRYLSLVRLTQDEDVHRHLLIAAHLAKECFPIAQEKDLSQCERRYEMYAAYPCPKMKHHNIKPQTELPKISQSVQAVWPNIIVRNPRHLQQFWDVLNLRIATEDAFYHDVVDKSIYVVDKCMLRMPCTELSKINWRNCSVNGDNFVPGSDVTT